MASPDAFDPAVKTAGALKDQLEELGRMRPVELHTQFRKLLHSKGRVVASINRLCRRTIGGNDPRVRTTVRSEARTTSRGESLAAVRPSLHGRPFSSAAPRKIDEGAGRRAMPDHLER